jgi:hypothetical protein
LLAYWKVTACIIGKVNDASLVIHMTVVVANDGTIGLVHAFGLHQLLWWKEVDGTLRNLKAVHFNGDACAIVVGQAPANEAMSKDREFGSYPTDASIGWSRSVSVWKI